MISRFKRMMMAGCQLLLFIVLFSSCNSEEEAIVPKPRGYFRIDLPENKYANYSSDCPFAFEHSIYSSVNTDTRRGAEPCWLDIVYPKFNGTIHLSYKPLDNNIGKFLEDSRILVTKHEIKASAIDEQIIVIDSLKVYGLIYSIQGNTASALQFYLTDSTRHFVRGALYFNAVPNSDSIAPVLEFIRKDVYRMIQSFRWREK